MQNKRILFLDLTCPKPYDSSTLLAEPLGGTEATVIRVAEALSRHGHRVVVGQHNRTDNDGIFFGDSDVAYTDIDHIGRVQDVVVALRTPKAIPFLRKQYPNAKLLLWCHDFNHQEIIQDYPVLEGTGVKILCVSRTHSSIFKDALLTQLNEVKGITVGFIYNPVADDLQPDTTPVDPNKLIYFSSPHKGLNHALKIFEQLRRIRPEYRLVVANPGYMASSDSALANVSQLGALPHSAALSELRSSFCVLHPNTVFPETFGLVYAEANALGVPCIAHSMGAVSEVLHPSNPAMDCRDQAAVVDRILKWREQGRPAVSCKPEFRLSNVIKAWEKEIQG